MNVFEKENPMPVITEDMIWSKIPVRRPDSHKGTYGNVLAVCGCAQYRGAAALCALGALRSGAGLTTLAAPEIVIASIADRILEATFLSLPNESALIAKLEKATACAAGCGKPESPETVREMQTVLRYAPGTIVLDAGGLCCLHPGVICHDTKIRPLLASCAGRMVLTPHPGEMAKLTGLSVQQILSEPARTALEYAAKTGAVVVLKGHHTQIASPDGALFENHTGNAGLSRGGSGDILTGIIAGLAAQGLSPADAALCGVWLHGRAADLCAKRRSMTGMLPSDILEDLGQIFLRHNR